MGKILTSEHRLLGSLLVGRGALKKGSKGTELKGPWICSEACVPLWSGSHLRQVGSGEGGDPAIRDICFQQPHEYPKVIFQSQDLEV